MRKNIFICTYQNQKAFETSIANGLLGFSTENAGAKGSIAKLKIGDLVFIRDNTRKNSLVCFGVFEVAGHPFKTDPNASLIWQEELSANKVIFTYRVPAKHINVVLPAIAKDTILQLQWKKRVKPYNEYQWQGLSRLFAVNFLEPNQAQQLANLWSVDFEKLSADNSIWQSPDEIENSWNLVEGAKHQVVVNAYERNPQAREDCLKHYGYNCSVCEFNFQTIFGEIGENFIHVHHLKSLASIGDSYIVNPVTDLRPVCPNCHAMLHKRDPAFSIDELRVTINTNAKP
jgi:predicted HNH restriction endonuclease